MTLLRELLMCLVFGLVLRQCAPADTPSPIPGGIPRLIHQIYIGGMPAIMAQSRQGSLHLDWMRSLKAHHPAWEHRLWDTPELEQLLETRYPWFLPLYRRTDMVILRADAMRIFVLHAFGGVYMDIDTEVYGNIEASLNGHSLVLSEQVPFEVVNSQMASAPGHPFWELMMQQAVQSLSNFTNTGPMSVLEATGPKALTKRLKEYLVQCGLARQEQLHGTYADLGWHRHAATLNVSLAGDIQFPAIPFSTLKIMQTGSWFNPCFFNDEKCHAFMIQCAPIIRTYMLCQWHEMYWPHAAFQMCSPGNHAEASRLRRVCLLRAGNKEVRLPHHVSSCIERFKTAVGHHHFTATWLGGHSSGDDKYKHVRREMSVFFNHSEVFVEAQAFCPWPSKQADYSQAHVYPLQQFNAWLDHALVPVSPVKDAPCRWVSIFQSKCSYLQSVCCVQERELAVRLQHIEVLSGKAKKRNCSLTLVTDLEPAKVKDALGQEGEGVSISHAPLDLAITASAGLTVMLNNSVGLEHRIHLLHISVPGVCGWAALGQLNNESLDILEAVQPVSLILQMGRLQANDSHLAYATYQQLLQSHEYIGNAHALYQSSHTEPIEGCKACDEETTDIALPQLWLGLARRSVLLRNLLEHRDA